jgi:hypothetical protein
VASIADIKERFRDDGLYYCEHAVRLPNEDGRLVAMVPRPAQRKIEQAIAQQQAQGQPIRILLLKSRRLGAARRSCGGRPSAPTAAPRSSPRTRRRRPSCSSC